VKPRGKHPHHTLTDTKVRQINIPGRYADGGGLYLKVDESLARRWVFRFAINRRRHDMGLGPYPVVSLKAAREQAIKCRSLVRNGIDPIAENRRIKVVVPTFADAATKVHSGLTFKNKKAKQQWINTLRQYVFPVIGQLRVDQISTPDVLSVLRPIWTSKEETARRVKQRIATVLDYAAAEGWRSGENPVTGVKRGLSDKRAPVKHHKALPYAQLPAFIQAMRQSKLSETAKLAFEFLILAAARTSEVLGATWNEVDLEGATWTIPASRMKAGREHRVPLSLRALEILERAKSLSCGSDLIFRGTNYSRPLSNMVFEMTLRRMKVDVTTHGFRSTFRDWASEQTNFSHEACERALAHTIKNKAEAAYHRNDLFGKRRELMERWTEFATRPSAELIRLSA
jgi:integrase